MPMESVMTEHSAQESYTGAEAAVAVAEIGLASWRAAKQAWLEAFARLPGPECGSARTSRSVSRQPRLAARASRRVQPS
jgi:hypothetical protein